MKPQLRGNVFDRRAGFAQQHTGFVVNAVAQQRQRRFPASLIATPCQMRGGHPKRSGIVS